MSQQQLQTIVQMLKANPPNPSASFQEMRAGFEQLAGMRPVDADVKREDVQAGGVKAQWLSAANAAQDRAILYLHGGGYVLGSIRTHAALAARISRASKARVLLIDYRLPPQQPFPAGGDHCVGRNPWARASG